MLPLAELQAAFARALLDRDAAAILAEIAADGWRAEARLAIYRNNVQTALTETLRGTFPAVCRLVGDGFFAYAAHEFLCEQPPGEACLDRYGARFADFLAGFPPCRDPPSLAVVARLEWLIKAAAGAADAVPLAPAALAAVAADDTPRLILGLHPAFGYLGSPWPIDRIWRVNIVQEGEVPEVDLGAGGVRLEISRRGADAVLRPLGEAVFALRHTLAAGDTLEAATARAVAADRHFDLAAALAELFGDGAVISWTLAA